MARRYEQTEWLSLVDITGPFLAGVVLDETFPQGLEKIETPRKQHLRSAYEEWDDARDQSDPDLPALHGAWTRLVLEHGLEFEDEVLADRQAGDEVPSYAAPTGEEVFHPDFALQSFDGDALLFVSVLPPGTALDQPLSRGWAASPIERMKLLCRAEKVRVGLVTNGEEWALVNAPEDDTSGHTTWFARNWWLEPVTLKAFVSLLGVRRFFGPAEERLDQLLQRSLKEHHEVTDTLGEQVRRAVEVLVQALGRADEDRNGELLKGVAPADLYNAGLTTMMRLVFLLCAEERELLLLGDPVYDQHYAVSTLRSKLGEDADQYGVEVLERRYDAWSRLLSLFRAVYGGIEHEALRMPAMGGSLFDPDRFPFLEGRAKGTAWRDEPASPLPIDNRTVMLLLRALQVLEHRGGARQLSYRGLDVEQIGHVYEGLLEYKVQRVPVLTLGLTGSAKVRRPTMSLRELERLLASGVSKAATAIAKATGRSKSAVTKALKRETELGDLPPLVHACGGDEELARRLLPFAGLMRSDSWGIPLVYSAGSFAVTLGEGRRESGSHYTPRALTEPIVATTLRPVLEGLGEDPTAEQLLGLKICDPAMGSGAFLVEACRQLGALVVEAWSRAEEAGGRVSVDGDVLSEPDDSELLSAELADRMVTARRLVTERCLYGVDKNPMAVDLAKLSLWLVTMAKGRPFGFLDHKLKHGDSLVGLSLSQIRSFHWKEQERNWGPLFAGVRRSLAESQEWRRAIADFGEFDYAEKQQVYNESERALAKARLVGDLVVAAFFGAGTAKSRERLRTHYQSVAASIGPKDVSAVGLAHKLRRGEAPVWPFHWEVEFPEVFGQGGGGFDAMVGNPPFLGGTRISTVHGMEYFSWLRKMAPGAGHLCDLIAYFLRRCFHLVRQGGSCGVVATNTIAQGDTRTGGLGWLCNHGAEIFAARRRVPWPGRAAVIVSAIHLTKGRSSTSKELDGRPVSTISAYLFHKGGSDNPNRLPDRNRLFSAGSKIYGQGFLFDEADPKASPPALMHEIIEQNPACKDRIYPYIGGREVNQSPRQSPRRHVIFLSDIDSEDQLAAWPELEAVIRARVKPERDRLGSNPNNVPLKRRWWAYQAHRPQLYAALSSMDRVLANSQVGNHLSFAFLPADWVYAHTLNLILLREWRDFAVLQCRCHEVWARFFGSSMKDDLRYTPSDCFETYSFPQKERPEDHLESIGQRYYEFRAELMVRNDEGLTKTYNRFHDPGNHDPDITKLRELHANMDRAVLDAYGWKDIPTDCEFLLDYEIDEETWGSKKKPYRYRWPDEVHDEVLARLLELNQKRYEEEVAGNRTGKKKAPGRAKLASRVKRPVKPAPRIVSAPEKPDPEMFKLGTAELVALDTEAAKRELIRRGRDPKTGKKTKQGKLFS